MDTAASLPQASVADPSRLDSLAGLRFLAAAVVFGLHDPAPAGSYYASGTWLGGDAGQATSSTFTLSQAPQVSSSASIPR